MGEKMQKKMPVISQMPTVPLIVCSQHRVQEAAMVAVRSVGSTLITGLRMQAADAHETCSPP